MQDISPKYCLYARKSTEAEEKQVLSIDSQIKEMTQNINKVKLTTKLDVEIQRFKKLQTMLLDKKKNRENRIYIP